MKYFVQMRVYLKRNESEMNEFAEHDIQDN